MKCKTQAQYFNYYYIHISNIEKFTNIEIH